MSKILFLDTETTGLDENVHAIFQLSCLVEENGKLIDEFNIKIRPFKGAKISKDAMQKLNLTVKDFMTSEYIPYNIAFEEFELFMSAHVDRYNKTDKFVIAGKNINFDIRFIREFFNRNNNDYYGSWFWYPSIDVETIVAELVAFDNLQLPNYQLTTLCEAFNIKLEKAHDAYEDIIATRKLYWKIKGVNI